MGMEPTPEVRQNTTPGDQYGSVAVKAGADRWLIGNPTNGAHWGADADVAGWTLGAFEHVVDADVVEDEAVAADEPRTAE